jgi:NADH-quinone oxidoreductase subunit C
VALSLEALNEHLGDVQAALVNTGAEARIERDEIVVICANDENLAVLQALRDASTTEYRQLIDVTAVDNLARSPRFDVVYHLLSHTQNQRVRIKCGTSDEQPIASAFDLFSSALWFEREVWDMYGIFFSGHPDLRRLLTDYGFEGHPLRKDFPLTGYSEVRYDEAQKRVVYEPVNLPQEFRNFDFTSPWEGQGLPGDEKAQASDEGAQ